MVDKSISQLDDGVTAQLNDNIPVQRGSGSFRITASYLLNLIKANLAAVANSGAYADLSGKPTIPSTTSQIAEGSNLYHTSSRATAIAQSVIALNILEGAGIDIVNNGNGTITISSTIEGIGSITTDDVPEGVNVSRQYFSAARVKAAWDALYNALGLTGQTVFESGAQTLTGKTLTNPVLNGALSGTVLKDSDTLAEAASDKTASSRSIKTYVDTAIANVTAGTSASEYIDAGAAPYSMSTSNTAADNATALKAACIAGINGGKPVRIPPGRFKCNEVALAYTDFTGGKTLYVYTAPGGVLLQQPGNSVIYVDFSASAVLYTPSSINNSGTGADNSATIPTSQDTESAIITMPTTGEADDFAWGDIVSVYDDTAYPYYDGTEKNYQHEIMRCAGFSGSAVYLTGKLAETYNASTVKVRRHMSDKRVRLSVEIESDSDFPWTSTAYSTSSQRKPALRLVGVHHSVITGCSLDKLYAQGVQLQGCWGTMVVYNKLQRLLNMPSYSAYGYGIDDYASACTLVAYNQIMDARHGYTTNSRKQKDPSTAWVAASWIFYGNTKGTTIANNLFINPNGCPIDTHQPARDTTFLWNVVLWPWEQSYGSVNPRAGQLRGLNTKVIGLVQIGGQVGIDVDFSVAHNADNTLIIEHCYFDQQADGPKADSPWINVDGGTVNESGGGFSFRRTLFIRNCHFAGGSAVLDAGADACDAIHLQNCTQGGAALNAATAHFLIGSNVKLHLDMLADYAGAGVVKPFLKFTGTNATVHLDRLQIVGASQLATGALCYPADAGKTGNVVYKGTVYWDDELNHQLVPDSSPLVEVRFPYGPNPGYEITGNYTIGKEDFERILHINAAADCVVTLPSTLHEGFWCGWLQEGAGKATFAAGASASVDGLDNKKKSAGQNAMGFIYAKAKGGFVVGGGVIA